MSNPKPHPHVSHDQYSPGDLIEVYEDELAVLVTDHLFKRREINPGEKVAFYRAGQCVNPTNPGKKDKIFHFRVYRP